MKKQMTLSTDRKSASEGEYIEIRWACDACPDSLYLAIDSERTQYSIAVSDSGTTRIPVPKSNGKMTVKLIGVISGKKVTESVDVRVKGAKRAKSNAPLSSRMKMFGEKIAVKAKIVNFQGLSSHADRDHLISWVKNYNPKPQQVFVVHGDREVAPFFAKTVEGMGFEAHAPQYTEVYDLIANKVIETGYLPERK